MKKSLVIIPFLLLTSCGPVSSPDVVSRQNQEGSNLVLAQVDEVLKNHMNRESGFEVKSESQIREKTKTDKKLYLPNGYSEIPTLDTVESEAKRIDHSDYKKECGNQSDSTIALGDRIADCRKVYLDNLGIKTNWISRQDGVSGEGNWSLVSVNTDDSSKTMIWYDFTTKLLWSDYIKDLDFEKAAMSTSRACKLFEKENKHSMEEAFVTWRLPTRSDFLQADINGARYILNNTDKDYWSATQDTVTSAWSINQATGNSTTTKLDQTKAVRCVGIALQ